MALNALEKDTIGRGVQMAKLVLDQLYPVIQQLNVIHDSAGGTSTTITQEDLDGEASLSGLTVQQLNDGMFVLTSVIRQAISPNITQLSQLAARD